MFFLWGRALPTYLDVWVGWREVRGGGVGWCVLLPYWMMASHKFTGVRRVLTQNSDLTLTIQTWKSSLLFWVVEINGNGDFVTPKKKSPKKKKTL
jgi:hypothetical protein